MVRTSTPCCPWCAPTPEGSPRSREVIERLRRAGCVAAEEEAQELIALAGGDLELEEWVGRREQGEPLAWIVGSIEFGGRRVIVDPGVYVPRHQTEELACRAAVLLPAGGRAVDLCTGSGAVAVHLAAEVTGAFVVGVDIDPVAARCARRNGVTVVVGEIDLPLGPSTYDVVTAVAPYVPTPDIAFLPRDVREFEPRLALDGGKDGLDVVRLVTRAAADLLRPGGWLLLELGGDQHLRLGATLDSELWDETTSWDDEDGDLRGLAVRRSPERPGTIGT